MEPSRSRVGDDRDPSQLQRGDTFTFLSDPAKREYLVLRVREGQSQFEGSGLLVYYLPREVLKEPPSHERLHKHLRLLCCLRERIWSEVALVASHNRKANKSTTSP